MGFSRILLSSLDLTNFLSWSCRGAVVNLSRRMLWLSLAQARPKSAQVRPRPGPGLGLGIWKSGNLEIRKFGIQKNQKTKIVKIKIRSVHNVGKVWISRERNLLASFGVISGNFFHGPREAKNRQLLLIFLGGPMGPIHPFWGHVLVSYAFHDI